VVYRRHSNRTESPPLNGKAQICALDSISNSNPSVLQAESFQQGSPFLAHPTRCKHTFCHSGTFFAAREPCGPEESEQGHAKKPSEGVLRVIFRSYATLLACLHATRIAAGSASADPGRVHRVTGRPNN
jgi:hypothetical protein